MSVLPIPIEDLPVGTAPLRPLSELMLLPEIEDRLIERRKLSATLTIFGLTADRLP